jgi:hypothetical protein
LHNSFENMDEILTKKIKLDFIEILTNRLESEIDVKRLHKNLGLLAEKEAHLNFNSNADTIEEMKSEIIKFYKNKELDKIKRK